ncbi:MAG: hypothetical protein Q4D38_04385 [Planctomycetia bacterium]|nr:hypothetical protein [Planctomycetia bacterium]
MKKLGFFAVLLSAVLFVGCTNTEKPTGGDAAPADAAAPAEGATDAAPAEGETAPAAPAAETTEAPAAETTEAAE